ncbi:hypothetical protein BJ878DRAFT_72130 [Calycina marina]|uniref:DUF7707 domain-containing protein n=1 Tax=Calycina marina TaxID=1763456 RepID=A0A9P7Z329_9HELO|nr:hypothetical protein BJ878DRAFT_72130 [Calycina marina]
MRPRYHSKTELHGVTQLSICRTICSGDTAVNICAADTLEFESTCSSTNAPPELTSYTGTILTFACGKTFTQCIVANPEDAAAQAACQATQKTLCGHLDLANFEAALPSSSSSSSSSCYLAPIRPTSSPTLATTTSTQQIPSPQSATTSTQKSLAPPPSSLSATVATTFVSSSGSQALGSTTSDSSSRNETSAVPSSSTLAAPTRQTQTGNGGSILLTGAKAVAGFGAIIFVVIL